MNIYRIQPQEEKKNIVLVKHIKFFPLLKQGQVQGFGKLATTLIRINIEHHSGDLFKFQWTPKGFSWTQPDKEQYQPERDNDNGLPIKDGKGNLIWDYLKPKVVVKGEVLRFKSDAEAATYLNRVLGPALAEQCFILMVNKIKEVFSKAA